MLPLRTSKRLLALLMMTAAVPLNTAQAQPAATCPNEPADILSAQEGQAPSPVSIDRFSWLSGHWVGSGPNGRRAEELWGSPHKGLMVGAFRWDRSDENQLLEVFTLGEQDGQFQLRLKHFDGDLTAWEEKDGFITFSWIKGDDCTAYFDGLSFQRLDADSLLVSVSFGEQIGRFAYRRQD